MDFLEKFKNLKEEDEVDEQEVFEAYKKLMEIRHQKLTNIKGSAVISYYNIQTEYLLKECMTTLIGFIFRLARDWEPSPKLQYVDLEDWSEVKNLPAVELEPYSLSELKNIAGGINSIVNRADGYNEEIGKFKEEFETKRLQNSVGELSDQEFAEVNKKMEKLKRKLAYEKFQATKFIYNNGLTADHKAEKTVKETQKIGKYKHLDIHGRTKVNQINLPIELLKEIVSKFLNEQFDFNPDLHARNATVPCSENNSEAEDRVPLYIIKSGISDRPRTNEFDALTRDNRLVLTVSRILSSEEMRNAMKVALDNHEQYRNALLSIENGMRENWSEAGIDKCLSINPSMDVYHRLNDYYRAYFEEIRAITQAKYKLRPDFTLALIIHNAFIGDNSEEEAKDFVNKRADIIQIPVDRIKINEWVRLEDFKENKMKTEFKTSKNTAFSQLLEAKENEQKFAEEYNKQRIRLAKSRSIQQNGPDAKSLANYTSNNQPSGLSRGLSNDELRFLNEAEGDVQKAKELENIERIRKQIEDIEISNRKRNLTNTEEEELKNLQRELKESEELLNVPQDANLVKVYHHDAKANEFTCKSFHIGGKE